MTTTDSGTSTKREVEIEVPAEVVIRETDAVVKKLQKFARLPGFRAGKVPPSVIRQRFPEEIRSEVIEALVPRYFRQQTEKAGLAPVSQPQVSDLHLHDGQPLRFKASFEVLPPIEIAGYEDLRVEKPDTSVSDQEVEDAIAQLREQNASYDALEDRPLQDGDFAQVSLNGAESEAAEPAAAGEAAAQAAATAGKPVQMAADKPVQMEDVLVEIGGGATVAEFTENLRGAAPGEERAFEVQYPQEFSDERLAGKRFSYKVRINGVKRKVLPELTEEFAKEVGVASVDELRVRMRENMERRKQIEAERNGKESMLDQLLQRHDFPIPESMVERQIDVRLERGLRALAAQGMRSEDMKRMDFPRLRAGQREAAVREVKASLLLDRIAERENVQVSDEEIESELQAIADQSRQSLDAVRSRLAGEGALDRIRARMRTDKALDVLYRRSA